MNFTLTSLMALLGSDMWTVPVAGFASASLTLVVGRAFLRSRSVTVKKSVKVARQHDPFETGGAMEQRVAPRRRGMPVCVQVAESENDEPLCEAWVEDRSVGGLGLIVNERLETGRVFYVKVAKTVALAPWVAVEVRSCRRRNGQFLLGAKFIDTPPWDVMMLFG